MCFIFLPLKPYKVDIEFFYQIIVYINYCKL